MNRQAVSPVVATILLVAITVILSVTLYALVGGISNNIEPQQKAGVLVTHTNDGLSWKITFVTVPPELSVESISLVLIGLDGENTLDATPLPDLKCPPGQCGWKIRFAPISGGDILTAGDGILIDKDRHPVGAEYLFFTDNGILAAGTF